MCSPTGSCHTPSRLPRGQRRGLPRLDHPPRRRARGRRLRVHPRPLRPRVRIAETTTRRLVSARARPVFMTSKMFFEYKGAIFWKMTAGMGDVVFAPLYEVLRRRGVEFEFFHRVDQLHLSDDARASTPDHGRSPGPLGTRRAQVRARSCASGDLLLPRATARRAARAPTGSADQPPRVALVVLAGCRAAGASTRRGLRRCGVRGRPGRHGGADRAGADQGPARSEHWS